MGNNWKITDTLTKVFAEEAPDGQGSIRLSTLHRETVSCVIAYFGAADWGRYWKVSVKAPEKLRRDCAGLSWFLRLIRAIRSRTITICASYPGCIRIFCAIWIQRAMARTKISDKRSTRTVAQPVAGCDGRCGACRRGLCHYDRNGN